MKIGVLGGGQLARMLALAGAPLGHRFVVWTPSPPCPSEAVATVHYAGWRELARYSSQLSECDVVTYEFENVPLEAAEEVAALTALRPGVQALRVTQDRWLEKQFLQGLGIPTAAVACIDDAASLQTAVQTIGLPAVLKTRREGYDGKGQRVLRQAGEAEVAWAAMGEMPAVLESWVGFRRELSLLAVRSLHGELVFYPLVENEHRDGILQLSKVPAAASEALQPLAEGYARRVLERLDYIGVLALELFDTEQGLLASELAPRVHNSGHWSIEGAVTSQFENHLRAIVGEPLGEPALRRPCVMFNLIGTLPPVERVLAIPGTHLHRYGKEPAPGRKLGHITLEAGDEDVLVTRQRALQSILDAC